MKTQIALTELKNIVKKAEQAKADGIDTLSFDLNLPIDAEDDGVAVDIVCHK